MHRFGLVLPFLDAQAAQRLLSVCRSAKAELGEKRELSLAEATLQRLNRHDIPDCVVRLDCSGFVSHLGDLNRFLSSQKLRKLRALAMPRFPFGNRLHLEFAAFPSCLKELSVELRNWPLERLGVLPKLESLKLWYTHDLDLTLFQTVSPSLTHLRLDEPTIKDCKGELLGLESLTSLKVDRWSKLVPLSVLHLSVGELGPTQKPPPSNLKEIARTLVTLQCGFPWPGIEEWPCLQELRFLDHFGTLDWRIAFAPPLHTFECQARSTLARDSQVEFPCLRTLKVPAAQLHLAARPDAIQHLCMFRSNGFLAPSAFSNLESLYVDGNCFQQTDCSRTSLERLEKLTIRNIGGNSPISLWFLTTWCPNLRSLDIAQCALSDKTIPTLPKLHAIRCDFWHTSLFQPQVKHLVISRVSSPWPSPGLLLAALENSKRLESLRIPFNPSLDTSTVLDRFPEVAILKYQ